MVAKPRSHARSHSSKRAGRRLCSGRTRPTMPAPPSNAPVESAQFVSGCREVGERASERAQVVVEHVLVDVVDTVTSHVIAAVVELAGLPAQALARLRVFSSSSPFSASPTGMPASMNGDSSSPRTR